MFVHFENDHVMLNDGYLLETPMHFSYILIVIVIFFYIWVNKYCFVSVLSNLVTHSINILYKVNAITNDSNSYLKIIICKKFFIRFFVQKMTQTRNESIFKDSKVQIKVQWLKWKGMLMFCSNIPLWTTKDYVILNNRNEIIGCNKTGC